MKKLLYCVTESIGQLTKNTVYNTSRIKSPYEGKATE